MKYGSVPVKRGDLQASRFQSSIPHLTSGRLLAHNTLWNLLGFLAPIAAGAIAIPVLIRAIGTSRFGVLSIAWIVVGSLGLFDLGLGRALTKLAAERIGGPEEHEIVPIAWTSLLLLFLLGVVGGVITYLVSPWLVYKALKVPAALQAETLHGFFVVAASIPLVTVTSGLRGLLEALQQFRILNLIRIPLSVFSFCGPLLVLPFSNSLVALFGTLVAGRFIGCVAHLMVCFQVVPAFRHNFVVTTRLVPALFQFGSWMTVSNLVGPGLLYVDRLLIGALLSLTAVTYYTAPLDILTRLLVIPAAVIGVLFPAFATVFKHEPDRAGLLLARSVKYIFMAVFPIILVVVTLSPEILRIWLGAAFEQNSAQVLRWLAAGIFLNSLAQVPFTLIQSAGRPDVTAKLIIVEFPIYFGTVWLMTTHLGIKGTAVAWAGRVALEGGFLFLYVMRLLPQVQALLPKLIAISSGGLAILYLASLLRGHWIKAGFLTITLVAFAFTGWRWALRPAERVFFLGGFGQVSDRIRAFWQS